MTHRHASGPLKLGRFILLSAILLTLSAAPHRSVAAVATANPLTSANSSVEIHSAQLPRATGTCTAQDSHGNVATPVTFLVTLKLKSTGTQDNSSSGILITVTGGRLINLECNTILNAFGVKVSFYNLCDHQAIMEEILANTLPAGLPNGYAFVKGLNITVLFYGDALKELPHTGGIELGFPITDNSQDQYAVLVWDKENKTWLDVTQTMKDADLTKMLSTEAENELYQILPTQITKALYRILSTDKAGTFVIVKK